MNSHSRLATTPLARALLVLVVHILGAAGTDAGFDDTVIVEVGQQIITAREIIDARERIDVGPPSGDDLADRKRLLEPIIQAKLLVAEAEALGLETRRIRRNLRRFENDFLVNALENSDIREMIVVDPDEVDEIVELQKTFLHLRHIVVAEQPTGLRIMDDIRAGADFAELAATHSLDAVSRDRGGRLPPLTWGMEDPAFMTVAYSLSPGHPGGPVQTESGWHVVTQDSVTRRDIDIDQAREKVAESMRKGAFNREQVAYLERMKQELHYSIHDATVGTFIEHMMLWKLEGYPDMSGDPDSADRFGFTAESHARPIFSYDGGAFTIADYSLYMEGSPDPVVGSRVTVDRVRRDCDQYFRHVAYADIARRRGYLEATGFDREIRRQRERALIGELERARVALTDPPDEQQLLAHYETHRDAYRQLAHVVVTEIHIAQAAGAAHLHADLTGGKPLDQALSHTRGDPEDPTRVARDVIIEAGAADWPAVATESPGAVVDLGTAEDGKRRLAVIQRVEPARAQGFDEVRGRVLENVTSELHQARYMALIVELREKYPVVIHDAELLELPL